MITKLKNIFKYVISPLFIILNVLAYYFAIYDSIGHIVHATYAMGIDEMITQTILDYPLDSVYTTAHTIEYRIEWAVNILLDQKGLGYIIYLCTPLVEVIAIDIVFLMASISARHGFGQYVTITTIVYNESIKEKTVRISTYVANVISYTTRTVVSAIRYNYTNIRLNHRAIQLT